MLEKRFNQKVTFVIIFLKITGPLVFQLGTYLTHEVLMVITTLPGWFLPHPSSCLMPFNVSMAGLKEVQLCSCSLDGES